MRRSLLLPTAAFAAALALGCADQVPTAPAESPVPAFSASVERSTGSGFIATGTDQRTMTAGIAAENLAAWCAGDMDQPTDTWSFLTVTRPDGSQKGTTKGNNVHILIWDIPGSIPFPGDFCSEAPAYTGVGQAIFTDSDVDLSHPGVDASGSTITGTVTDASGHRYHLVAAIRFTVPENTLDNFVIHAHAEKIELTPIGH